MAAVVIDQDLAQWLADDVGGPRPELVMRSTDGTAGFSGHTVLLEALWDDPALPSGAYVLKTAPVGDPHPLFPAYDLGRQVEALRLAGEHTDAPVPRVRWFCEDAGPLGHPFVVMERVDGWVASDMPPYTFGGHLHEIGESGRRSVERSFVTSLAAVHAPDSTSVELDALELAAPGATPLERHVAQQLAYYDWIRAGRDFPLIESVFARLDSQMPTEDLRCGIVWGDARLANAMIRDDEVVALLDWEAAAVGPPELDLAWSIYFADYFQRIAIRHGFEGLPTFMAPAATLAAYREAAGRAPAHMEWFLLYAALRQALTSIRVTERAVLRGQQPEPEDHQDLIADRAFLEELLSGRTPLDTTRRSA